MKFKKNNVTGRCDFIIAQNILEYMGIRRGRSKRIYSIPAKIISPEDLVIHKITSDRARDLEDLRGILIRQGPKLDTRYILFWLKKIAKANHKPGLVNLFKNLLKLKAQIK